jgi:hypothetical protein
MLILLTLMACSGDDSDTLDSDVSLDEFTLDELTPENDAVNVPLDTNITAQFDRDLRIGDIGVMGRASVSGINGDTLTAELSAPLDRLTSYTIQTLGITSVDGDIFPDIQTRFTTRDGAWQWPGPVIGQTELTDYASASSGDAVLVLTAKPNLTQVVSMGVGTQSAPVTLDTGVAPDNTWLAANAEHAVAVWTQSGDLYASSQAADGSWTQAEQLSASAFMEQTPTGLALTTDGTAAVGWRSSSARVRVVSRIDGSWSEPANIGCAEQAECTSIRLFTDHTGEISGFVHGLTAEGQLLQTSAMRDGEWTVPTVLFSVDGDISEPVVRTQAGATLAMWRVADSEDAGLFMSWLSDDGDWSPPLHVRDSEGISTLELVARADGGWTAAWVQLQPDSEVDTYNLWVSSIEDTALTDPFRLIESTTPLVDLDLAADAGGNLHLTWTEQGEPSRLLTRRFNHRTGWDDAVEVATATGPAEVLVLPGNRGHAVFVQDDELATALFE